MKVSAIIVNYNAGDLLANCVRSILHSSIEVEVIVVDNCSQDNSVNLLDQFRPSGIKIILNDKNLGFAAACNIGIDKACGKHLVFLNPDSIAHPDALKILSDFLDDNYDVGMVGGRVNNPDGTLQQSCCRTLPTPGTVLSELCKKRSENTIAPKIATEVEAISGACMMVSRKAILDVGPMDSSYFLHCEDLDWCQRFRLNGWKIYIVPAAYFIHIKGGCSRKGVLKVEWHKHRGMMLFNRKYYKDRYSKLTYLLINCGIMLHFVMFAPVKLIVNLFRE